MEELMEIAKKKSDMAEVYSVQQTHQVVSFKNAKLHDIDTKFQSGLSLRIIKSGRLGFAYTRNLINRDEILDNALDSLKGGVEADYGFPPTRELPAVNTFDPSIEKISSAQMADECVRVCGLLKSETRGEISAAAFVLIEDIRIINSNGGDLSSKSGVFAIYTGAVYPGTSTGIRRSILHKSFKKMPESTTDEMIKLYKMSSDTVEPKSGNMQVIFMPNSAATLNWRILSGTSSKSIYERTSPIADRVGEKVFDEKVTVYDDPLNDKYPGARVFDDEGVACAPLSIVENGILKNFYYDLGYARKLDARSTGHGYKSARWGGDVISLKPSPTLSHMYIMPGRKSFWELIGSMERGIILEGALGAHSGNIPNGDYSVGASPGIYVEKGEIVGRVKDTMVAGNIYETLSNVVDLGDTLHHAPAGGWVPPILVEGVSVATKS